MPKTSHVKNAAAENIWGGLEKKKQERVRPWKEYVANSIKNPKYSDVPVSPQLCID